MMVAPGFKTVKQSNNTDNVRENTRVVHQKGPSTKASSIQDMVFCIHTHATNNNSIIVVQKHS